eukprot:3630241-Pleurochrysis_carterae.AAC.2
MQLCAHTLPSVWPEAWLAVLVRPQALWSSKALSRRLCSFTEASSYPLAPLEIRHRFLFSRDKQSEDRDVEVGKWQRKDENESGSKARGNEEAFTHQRCLALFDGAGLESPAETGQDAEVCRPSAWKGAAERPSPM